MIRGTVHHLRKQSMLEIPRLTWDDEFRFWCNVDRSNPDGCWLWSGSCNGAGRAVFKIKSTSYVAARIAYKIEFGRDPGLLHVCHDCTPNPDNIKCVQPKHFWLGTQQENSLDHYDKGGIPSFGNQRLTLEQMKTIKSYYEQGISVSTIAKEFKISRVTVWHIATKRKF